MDAIHRSQGPELSHPLFMSATVQGDSSFLITGGYIMELDSESVGTRSSDMLIFSMDATDAGGRWDKDSQGMKRARGGHAAIKEYIRG